MRHDNRDLIGTVLDRKYKVIEFLGEGGMGTVYKVQHLILRRECAVKIIRRRHAADLVAIRRFQLEAEAASLLQHPNIIEVYDYGITQENLPYMVMEYLDGESLDDLITRNRHLRYAVALPIFLQVCEALAHAHERKVLHRDLKPENIMICKSDSNKLVIKLLDFGVAKLLPGTGRAVEKLSITGEICGSPMYMSPEQCMGQSLDFRSDIYSLGCVFYEALTGQVPCSGDSLFQIVMKQVNEMPPPFEVVAPNVSIPIELERIVIQCLAKERALRFSSVEEVRAALAEINIISNEGLAPAQNFVGRTPDISIDGNTVTFTREQMLVSTRQAVEEALWKEVRMLEEKYGSTCRYLIGPLADLYRLYKEAQQFNFALEVKNRQMELIEIEFGENSIDAAYCFEELGQLHSNLGAPFMSEYAYKESLRMKSILMGEDDPDSCRTRIQLANVLMKQDRFSEAESYCEDAVLGVYRSTGTLSLDAANIEILAGNFYYEADSLHKAYDHFEAASMIVRDVLGDSHIKLSDCYMDMARCKHFLGDAASSIELCKKVIAINEANPEHKDILFDHPWQQLVWSYKAQRNYLEAENACFKRMEIIQSFEEPMNAKLLQIYETLVQIYKDSRQLEKAGAWRQRTRELAMQINKSN